MRGTPAGGDDRIVQVDYRLIEELQEREQQLAEAQRLARLGSWEWDIEEDRVRWSDEMYRIFGLDPQELDLTHAGVLDRVHPDDRLMLETAVANALANNESYQLRHRLVRADGTVRLIDGRGAAVVDSMGSVVRLHGTARDVTEALEVEVGARDTKSAIELVRLVAVGIDRATDIEGVLRFALGEVCRHRAWPLGHAWLDGDGSGVLVASGVWHGEETDRAALLHEIAEAMPALSADTLAARVINTRRPEWGLEFVQKVNSGGRPSATEIGPRAVFAVPIVVEGEVSAVLEFFATDLGGVSDVFDAAMRSVASAVGQSLERTRTRQRLAEGEVRLAHVLAHDPLTGLANRSLFVERVTRALALAARSQWSTAVIALNIDGFHDINHELGHDVGDALLVAFARRLEAASRQHDTVARRDGSLARIGADEFLVLCENVPDAGAAVTITSRLLAAVATPLDVRGRLLSVTASAGVARTDPGGDPGRVLLDAEAALARAKVHGGGRFETFDAAAPPAAASGNLRGALQNALERGELHLVYQPKVSLATDRIVGVEALLRWDHPERGPVSPGEFIPLVEASGQIVEIGAWVLLEACRQVASWQLSHPRPSPLTVAINVSARQFRAGLADIVREAIAETGIDPTAVFLEVTETTVMEDVDFAISVLAELKGLGLKVSIDDFGTGYSSLAYLRRLPLDEVKIDKTFVDGLGADPEDTAIVAAVISLAHALDREVVAEGVETLDQLERLRSLGCELAQGFFLARPMPAVDLAALLAQDSAGERLSGGETGPTASRPGVDTVLVADDTADIRQLARMSLTAGGFTVEEAADGASTIELARRLIPDCVVLDVRMPDMTGIEVCRALRSDPTTAGCTIVMLTGRAEAADKAEAFSAGADDYIVKPFAPRDLVSRVRSALRRRRGTHAP